MPAPELRDALDLAARAGEYFAVADLAVPHADGEWRSLRELVDDPAVVADRVAVAQSFLADRTRSEVELRACASINSLGMMSRLVSPALACAVLAGAVPRFTLDGTGWRPVEGGPVPLAVRTPAGEQVSTGDEAARAIIHLVVLPVVEPVLERYRTQFSLSPQTLWGNVASALSGAAGMLRRSGLPLLLDPDDVLAALLADGPVAGAGRFEQPFPGRRERFFIRTNCCLFYRVPAGGKCGDCVLVPEEARHAMWRDVLERR